jgi:hypothetical protein
MRPCSWCGRGLEKRKTEGRECVRCWASQAAGRCRPGVRPYLGVNTSGAQEALNCSSQTALTNLLSCRRTFPWHEWQANAGELTMSFNSVPHHGHLPLGSPMPTIGPMSGARMPAMITGMPRTAPKTVQQSIPPTMMHMGATMSPKSSPLKACLTGACSDSGGVECTCGWILVPHVGQKLHGLERCVVHFGQWSDMEKPSLGCER